MVLRRGHWVVLSLAALAAAVAATGANGASTGSGAVTRDRTTSDMPDEISGPQVHFLYVVPADGADRQLDTNGQMEQSIARIEEWLIGQTGDQGLRVDTHDNGAPDITFVRMRRTDAQATAVNPWPLWVMGEDLVAAGFNDPAKVYAAFYDGHSASACGGATSPALPKLGAMYLQAQPTGLPYPCSAAPGFGTGSRPGYFEIGLLHEILHAIGYAPSCAPHVSNDIWRAHVNDSPTDIMYSPDAAHTEGWNWSNAVLDFNRDDYYRANVPGCRDLSTSPYLAPLHSVSVTVNGPGAVTSSPPGIYCPDACIGKFQRSVTLTAKPSPGARFTGWTGACAGTAACVMSEAGSVTASFVSASHRRSLTFQIRAGRATGVLRVLDGYGPCRAGAAVLVERRGGQGWATVRRTLTNGAGRFAVSVPAGRATYRARAPVTKANGQTCVKALSPAATTAG